MAPVDATAAADGSGELPELYAPNQFQPPLEPGQVNRFNCSQAGFTATGAAPGTVDAAGAPITGQAAGASGTEWTKY